MAIPKEEPYDHLYKVVLVGDASVGKTNLLSRYMKGVLPRNAAATVGVEFATRTVKLDPGGNVKVQIWDTAGTERYRAITSAHYRKAVGALLVYDLTKLRTYENCERWLEELRNGAGPEVVIMLVGNKFDLAEQDPATRKVPLETAQEFAERNGLLFAECSAVTNHNVTSIFEGLFQEIYNKTGGRPTGGGMHITDAEPQERAACAC
eukprot:CAMPEP_0183549896 /NCGR_PEP_ID=MMETSP0371-20130417/63851_1 /TAXON_ID=268820 /ORGANISM="Peridinium aciculiferum, Strain PAER-2" /LENGTH=206 /DNA_ID=CAMNT_0025753833 /DNA_START=76 /DNA_END=696 /DNA_ORIENTATION=-